MTRAPLLAAAALAAMVALPQPALGWGKVGHEAVAAIAEERLGPEARAMIRDLIGSGRLSDPDIAVWADEHRDAVTGSWHYVNIPFSSGRYEPTRDCRHGGCAVAAIERAVEELAGDGDRQQRLGALRWLVHLVADLHQPLHAGDGWDRGGNGLRVRLGSRREPTNLHHVWDTEVVQALARGRGPLAVARQLGAEIDAGRAAGWKASLSPAAWAEESSREARAVYAMLGVTPREQEIVPLGPGYAEAQQQRVGTALQRAGVRLAALLDRIAVRR
jgi:hypothetical protein